MKIKALRVIAGGYGVILEGDTAVVSDSVGKELISAGLAVEVGDEQPKEVVHKDVTVKVKGKLK